MTEHASPFDILRPATQLAALDDLSAAAETATVLSVSGRSKNFATLPERKALRVLAARDLSQQQLEMIARMTRLEGLTIWGYRGDGLAALTSIERLAVLAVGWAPRLTSLDDIGRLTGLAGLGIADMGRVDDISPLARITGLRALAISGSFTKAQRLRSLEPLAALRNLNELSLDGVRVDNDDFRPIARLRHLQKLQLWRGFPVREYARLSVALPHVACEAFAPTSRIEHMTWDPVQKKSVPNPCLGETILIARPIKMVSAADTKGSALIAKRIAEHERWQAHYRCVPDPAADDLMELPALPKPRASRAKRKP